MRGHRHLAVCSSFGSAAFLQGRTAVGCHPSSPCVLALPPEGTFSPLLDPLFVGVLYCLSRVQSLCTPYGALGRTRRSARFAS